MSKVHGRAPDLSTLAASPSSNDCQPAACISSTAYKSMAVQADVIAFDEAGSSAALGWLQQLQAQAAKDSPKDLFSLFTRSATVRGGSLSSPRSETLDYPDCTPATARRKYIAGPV